MNRAEKLQEQYEDALFALLMDRIVVSEGEAALKEMEMLEEDPDFIVPDSCIHRCQQIISDCAKGYRRKNRRTHAKTTFKRIVLVAVISMMLFATAMAASDSFRMKVVNYAFEFFSDHMTFGFVKDASENSNSSDTMLDTFECSWVPEGYVLEDSGENFARQWKTYYNADTNGLLDISIFDGEEQGASIDIEDATVQNVSVRGLDGKLVEKDNWNMLFLVDLKNTMTIQIQCDFGDGEGIPREELIKVAENLRL